MSEAADVRFEDIQIGQLASFDAEVTQELVDTFVRMSGDRNPLHVDETYASGTQFGGVVVHGFAVASFFSTLIGMHLPGRSALYLSQTLLFRAPVKVGMTVRVQGEVTHKTESSHTLTIKTTIADAATSRLLIDGVAMAQVLQ